MKWCQGVVATRATADGVVVLSDSPRGNGWAGLGQSHDFDGMARLFAGAKIPETEARVAWRCAKSCAEPRARWRGFLAALERSRARGPFEFARLRPRRAVIDRWHRGRAFCSLTMTARWGFGRTRAAGPTGGAHALTTSRASPTAVTSQRPTRIPRRAGYLAVAAREHGLVAGSPERLGRA